MDDATLQQIKTLNMLNQALIDHVKELQFQISEAMRLSVQANYRLDVMTDYLHAAGICLCDGDPPPSSRVEGL